ncbi:MAG: transglycosylase domain-containing protein [Caldilineaceae bacterium]
MRSILRVLTRFRKISLLVLLLPTLVAVLLYQWLLADLPPITAVEQRLVRPTTQILDRKGRVLYEVLDPEAGKQINLDLTALPQRCVEATLATEDSRFYLHPGVDPIAIARAFWQNYRAGGDIVSGGSTLTQQLARNLLMEPRERYEQSLRRKLREAWLAWRLEHRYTKNELLALYLNQTYYGNFAFGLEAAAQIFFAKPAPQLSGAECTLLAGLVQYPTGYNPLQDPEVAKLRQLTVLRLMREADYLTKAEADTIAAEPLRYRSRLFEIEAPHFVMYVQDLLLQQLGPERLRDGGLRVVTTLDLDLQRQAERAVRHRLELINCRLPGVCDTQIASKGHPKGHPNRRVDNAAAVILDSHTGDILAMVGSPNYFDESIGGNVNAALVLRQPGSAIKPLTYAAALDPQWSAQVGLPPLTPASIIADLPTTFYVKDEDGGNVPYVPVNYDRLFHGPVSVRTALANSYNIPAVKTLDRIGVNTLQQLATAAGISTFTGEAGLALTLGGSEVKLLELTAAYGILDDGRRLNPKAIREIEQLGDWVIGSSFTTQSPNHPITQSPNQTVISPATAYLITDILSDKVARIPAFGEGSVLALPFPAAVKTGTTTDWRDNWTIGYSTERVVGVWVGNADNTPMLDVSGIDGAGPIWRDLMLAAHADPPAAFSRPPGIEEVTICAPSGLLPTPACPRTRRERFLAGSTPTQPDNQFQSRRIDLATQQAATPDTPLERISERVYWLLPPEYHDWMVSQGIPIEDCRLTIVDCSTAVPSANATDNRQSSILNRQSSILNPQLILQEPTSHTAYQIHPGLPRANQRIAISGYTADGAQWAALRLIKDETVLTETQHAIRIQSWWVLEPGQHQFWLEGKPTADADWIRSNQAFVVVENFVATQASASN